MHLVLRLVVDMRIRKYGASDLRHTEAALE